MRIPVRIGIDLRCLQSPPPRGGVGVFAEHCTRELLARDSTNEYLLFANGLVHPERHLPHIDAPNARWIIGHWPNRWVNGNWILGIGNWSFPTVDVLFLPNLNFLPPLPHSTRLVVTVHDLSFEHFPDCFTMKQRLWHRMIRPRRILARADAIVAVSETTKRDIVKTYRIPEGKVHVVYPGIEMSNDPHSAEASRGEQCPTTNAEYGTGNWALNIGHSPFILSLSEISPRKNLDGLIAAYELLIRASKFEIPDLVLAGAHGSATRTIARQIARSLARDRIHFIGPITEHEKCALLSHASCFAYPSLWEGFGFPPLEAMAAGVPVVASTGGALPEVLGDAALLIDPLDPVAIARAMTRVLTDDALRVDLVARGRRCAERYYRGEDAACRTLDLLTDDRTTDGIIQNGRGV